MRTTRRSRRSAPPTPGSAGRPACRRGRRGPQAIDVEVTLLDASELPIAGALVEVTAYPIARSAKRVQEVAVESDGGRYVVTLPAHRSGLWDFDIVADVGVDRYTARVRKSVLVTPRSGPAR